VGSDKRNLRWVTGHGSKRIDPSAHVVVPVLVCNVVSGYVKVRNTVSEIEEVD
jgi:hypothetical protein